MLARCMDPMPRSRSRAVRDESRRIAWFVAVGTAAAAVHWLVVVAVVESWRWPPLLANVLGWLVAFGVSFGGHQRLTFGDRAAPVRQAAIRFFGLSAAGFAVNEAAYAALLRLTTQRYDLLLAGVLLGVAVITYLLSRQWAFRRRPAP